MWQVQFVKVNWASWLIKNLDIIRKLSGSYRYENHPIRLKRYRGQFDPELKDRPHTSTMAIYQSCMWEWKILIRISTENLDIFSIRFDHHHGRSQRRTLFFGKMFFEVFGHEFLWVKSHVEHLSQESSWPPWKCFFFLLVILFEHDYHYRIIRFRYSRTCGGASLESWLAIHDFCKCPTNEIGFLENHHQQCIF